MQPKHIFCCCFFPSPAVLCVPCSVIWSLIKGLPPMRCSRIHQYHMCVPISGSTCHMPECAGVMPSVCQPSHCQPPRPSVFISRGPWGRGGALTFTVSPTERASESKPRVLVKASPGSNPAAGARRPPSWNGLPCTESCFAPPGCDRITGVCQEARCPGSSAHRGIAR